jgi:hypothetical protein
MSCNLAFILVFAAAFQSGCAVYDQARCLPGEKAATGEHIYFGTAKPGGTVSHEEWASYLAKSVTPRFPAGLSVWPAAGQWQSAQGGIVKEASFVLSLVYETNQSNEAAIRALVSEYKLQFQQEAVLRVKSHVCTSL